MMNILIVDDNENSRIILKKILESDGHTVEVATNGEEALKTAKESLHDMIISDILMPVMDGFRFCKEVKGDDDLKNIPFLFYTATYTDSRDEELALSLGADRFIIKPMEPDEFIKIIQAVIRDVKEGKIKSKKPELREEKEVFKLYSERLVKKLEQKMINLESEVAERKQAKETLRESEEKYRVLINGMGDTAWVIDFDANFIDVNDAAVEVLGYSMEELLSMGPQDIDTSIDVEEIKGLIKQIPTDEIQVFETTHTTKDGKTIPVEVKSSLVTYQGKQAIFSVARDITERKRAEEALRESEKKYRRIFENIQDVYYESSLDGTILEISPSIENVSQYKRKELIGRSLYDIYTNPEKRDAFVKFILDKGKVNDFEISLTDKDGSQHPCSITTLLVKDEQGNPIKFIGSMHDISERKQAEEESKKLEAQLAQSQKMEAIGILAGGIAHDFNNLLTVIIGNAQLAMMDVIKDESLRKGIEEIKKAGDKATFLTRQLLAFSRKQIIKPQVLDLNKEINNTEKMLKRVIGEDIEFLAVLEPELWKVYADSGQIDQVIMNLAVNARDAMPQGGKLTIETANMDLDESYFHKHGIEEKKPGPYVMLAVSDTGSGMDKKTREHIFEPFFTTKEVGKGTGLGLSTVYGIVKQNNGFIWVYSKSGQGTTFKVYLPKVKGDAEPEEKEQTPVDDLGGSETVLIVEDDDGLRKFAQEVLLRHGYRVLDAENGEEALKIGKEHEGQIDLMITDVVMPKMGGKEAADRLQPFYPRMKVIYMSGYTDNAIIQHGVLAPGLNFLQKPFTPESLARKVREALGSEK